MWHEEALCESLPPPRETKNEKHKIINKILSKATGGLGGGSATRITTNKLLPHKRGSALFAPG